MLFTLGYVAGIVTSTLIFAVLAFFRAGIEKRVKIIETVLGNAGPRPKGAIFLPEDENESIRQDRIRENAERGHATQLWL
jgi:hypothetical protein